MLGQEPVVVENPDALVQQAVDGSAEAFARLYDLHIDRIYRHLYYRLGNASDAEELAAEVFFRAWRAIGRYRQQGVPFIGWLYRIARNLLVEHYRSARRVTSLEESVVAEAVDVNPEQAAEISLAQAEVRQAVLRLNGEQQQVIILRFVDGLSHAEVAAVLGKREGAVRVIQYRALLALRRILEGE